MISLTDIFFSNPLIATCFPVLLGGLIGSRTGKLARTVYADLRQPPGKPPSAAFPIVWTTIYAATGYASYLCRANPRARELYTLSLVFNFGMFM